jgi:CRISPR-associated protein Cas1
MILYLIEQGAKVIKESQRFQIHYPGASRKIEEVRINDVEEIYIFGRISLSSVVIQTCLKRKIPVHFLTFSGDYLGKLQHTGGKNVELRLLQFQAYFNPEKKLSFARAFITGKFTNQIHFLTELKRRYNEKKLEGIIFRLKMSLKEVQKVQDIKTLMGIEGSASKVYFEALGPIFKKLGWNFSGRTRRPPTDPVNALLSLGYTLLFSKIFTFVETASLDPYLGFLHTPDYGKPSLVLDLMEEWRPVIVDSLVIRCLAWKIFTPQDFTDTMLEDEQEYKIKLTPAGLKKFLKQFQQKIMKEETFYFPLGKKLKNLWLLKEQVYHLARVLKGEEKEYKPFLLKHTSGSG